MSHLIFRKKITFLFKAGRKKRLAVPGDVPTEFFYGMPQLRCAGWDVDLLEDVDLGMGPCLTPIVSLINRVACFFGGPPIGMALLIFFPKYRKILRALGIIVVTTNGMGLALGIAKMVGIIKKPVFMLAMGLISIDSGNFQFRLYRMIVRHLFLVSFSRSEQSFLSNAIKQPVAYLNFGVDKVFWSPSKSSSKSYILAIGNDRNRDWETLINSWDASLPPLKIVTSLPVPSAPPNVEVIKGDWRESLLSDEDIRDLLWGARFVVVPLKDTIQPAGQSACLQAMACGKAVILSDISGIWDSDLMVDRQSVLLTPPGDASALAERVRTLLEDPALVEQIGAAGRKVIEEHLNSDAMAHTLETLLKDCYD